MDSRRWPASKVSLSLSLGFEGSRRNNLYYIAPHILIHACGNVVHFLDVQALSQTFLPSVEGGGIGAVAVHPSKEYFAVCEKGLHPNVYIYNFPSLEQVKVLKKGTEILYTAAAFNHDGQQLATVGGHPDYWLTIWDWSNETIILQSKAFSQEVFNVSFSKYISGQLITTGIGHIRFWQMATTFTGLKLEGFIGKFGQVPLSDIAGYVELPDGKVLSGTETGSVLVWDGGLIKCQLRRPGGLPCHDGMIEIIILDENAKELLTAGSDGCVRFWDLKWLDAADDGDEKLISEVNPLRELQLDERCRIKGIILEADHWLVQDECGALWKVHIPSFEVEKVLEFHAGAIVAMASSPIDFHIATAGSDGTVRLFNFENRLQLYSRKFSTGATSIIWLPQTIDATCRTIVVGFSDGVIRILFQTDSSWKLIHAKKPHTRSITAIRLSLDGELLATSSIDGTVFFFRCSDQYKPLGFVKAPGPVTCIDWSPSAQQLLLGCNNGAILEVPRPSYDVDTSITFELNLPTKPFVFSSLKVQKEISPRNSAVANKEEGASAVERSKDGALLNGLTEETANEQLEEPGADERLETKKERTGEDTNIECSEDGSNRIRVINGKLEEGANLTGNDSSHEDLSNVSSMDQNDVDPGNDKSTLHPIRFLLYSHGSLNTFYIAFEGPLSGFLYEFHIDMKDLLGFTEWLPKSIRCLGYSHSNQYLISGADDGVVRIQTSPMPGQLSLSQNKYWQGRVHDMMYGTVGGVALSYDNQYLASVAYDGSFFVYKFDIGATIGKHEAHQVQGKGVLIEEAEDIGTHVYSIEEDRQKTEQDNKLKMALDRKEKVREKIAKLRTALSDLLKENNEQNPSERLQDKEFEIDQNLRSMVDDEINEKMEIARKELQWECEKKNIGLSKLRCYFLDSLEVERIVLHAFRTGTKVGSFRTSKISPNLKAAISEAKFPNEKLKESRVSVLSLVKQVDSATDEALQQDEN